MYSRISSSVPDEELEDRCGCCDVLAGGEVGEPTMAAAAFERIRTGELRGLLVPNALVGDVTPVGESGVGTGGTGGTNRALGSRLCLDGLGLTPNARCCTVGGSAFRIGNGGIDALSLNSSSFSNPPSVPNNRFGARGRRKARRVPRTLFNSICKNMTSSEIVVSDKICNDPRE